MRREPRRASSPTSRVFRTATTRSTWTSWPTGVPRATCAGSRLGRRDLDRLDRRRLLQGKRSRRENLAVSNGNGTESAGGGTFVADDEPGEASTRAMSARGDSGGVVAIVLSGGAKGTTRPLRDTLRIGKAPDNDLVLPDDTVSRHHCELVRSKGGIQVKDLGSTNGTRVQGARITEAVVSPGAVLKVGEV